MTECLTQRVADGETDLCGGTPGHADGSSQHVVEFYDDEGVLSRSVGRFLARGLAKDDAAIVLATPEHLRLFEQELLRRRLDPSGLCESGHYVRRDARETLSQIVVDGKLDKELFFERVGTIIIQTLKRHSGICAYGELVALLCADGNLAAAEQLEDFWNSLIARFPLSLYCAYPQSLFRGPEKWGSFLHICQTHSEIVFNESKAPQSASDRVELNDRCLAAIVESSDDAIFTKDLNNIITTWNKGAERVFGYTAEEAIGQSVSILGAEGSAAEEAPLMARIKMGERIEHFETVRRKRDGSLVDVSLTISPVKDGAGRVIGASKIVRDISERKRQERALAESRAQLIQARQDVERRVEERTASLREAIAQLEQFSWTVSHDLRAPLRAMHTYSSALREDFGGLLSHQPEASRYLDRIADNCQRLEAMIRDVLSYSRLSHEQIPLEPTSIDNVVEDVIRHSPSLQPPRAEVRAGRLGNAMAHKPSLTQVMANLLGNAVKFVAPGTQPRVEIASELQNGHVRLSIRDNGIGINPAQRARLFNMFERLHPSLGYEGSGVGLAIVRKAVERMRGQVGVDPNPGGGSCFWVKLPAAI